MISARKLILLFTLLAFWTQFSHSDTQVEIELEEDSTPQQSILSSKPTPLNLLDLNDLNFESIFQSSSPDNDSAKWCKACVRFEKELEKFIELGKPKVNIAKIDISESPATTARLLVFKIPTLLHEANLTRHFMSNEWKNMEARPEYLSPFSYTGKSLALFASVGNKAVSYVEDMKEQYSPKVVYGILAAIPLILLLIILLVTKKAKPSVKDTRKKKNADDESKKEK